jgi:hypothetical protein
MFWLAHTCLMAQIILAPLLLGGLRPWALAILAILTGIGILAVCLRPGQAPVQVPVPVQMAKPLRYLWLVIGGLIVWSILQSLPIWPDQTYPFDAARIALAPYGWLNIAVFLIWFGGVTTLTGLVAQSQNRLHILIGRAIIIACILQVLLAAGNDLTGWQTTFWFAKQAHLGDWTGSFANRNAFGTLMGFGILACLYFYAQCRAMSLGKQLDRAGGWLALAMIFAVALVQSHSRLAFVMTIIGSGLFIVMKGYQNARRASRLLIVALGCSAAITLATITSPELWGRFTDLSRAIAERPFTGWGADSIALVLAHFATPDLNANANWFSSHNLWLDGAITLGIPVMLILITALVAAFKAVITPCQNPDIRSLMVALFVMGMIGSIGDWVMVMPALILPVVMLGMAGLAATVSGDHATAQPAGRLGQPPVPDQATLHSPADLARPDLEP